MGPAAGGNGFRLLIERSQLMKVPDFFLHD